MHPTQTLVSYNQIICDMGTDILPVDCSIGNLRQLGRGWLGKKAMRNINVPWYFRHKFLDGHKRAVNLNSQWLV